MKTLSFYESFLLHIAFVVNGYIFIKAVMSLVYFVKKMTIVDMTWFGDTIN